MRKLGYIILGFIIGALVSYYYCCKAGIYEEEIEIVKPVGVITPDDAKALNKNWTEYRKSYVDSAARAQGRTKDNRWAWWSLQDLQDYLVYAQKESNKLGYDMTGVRIYLGVYGKNSGQTKKNLTTMFMVPTGKKLTEEASFLNLNFQGNDKDVPLGPPLNDGTGGTGGYPN